MIRRYVSAPANVRARLGPVLGLVLLFAGDVNPLLMFLLRLVPQCAQRLGVCALLVLQECVEPSKSV